MVDFVSFFFIDSGMDFGFSFYGFLMNLSISDLFLGGLFPGILMVIAMQLACYLVCKKKGWGKLIPFNFKNSLVKGGQAYLGFTAIFIVIVGIYGGIFSPTEAAGVTAGFCLLAGLFITKGITIRAIPDILLRSGQITGLLAPLIAVSIVMQQILSLLGARQYITEIIGGLGGYYPILFACMLLVFITGTFLETLPDTIILAPILAPVLLQILGLIPFILQ